MSPVTVIAAVVTLDEPVSVTSGAGHSANDNILTRNVDGVGIADGPGGDVVRTSNGDGATVEVNAPVEVALLSFAVIVTDSNLSVLIQLYSDPAQW